MLIGGLDCSINSPGCVKFFLNDNLDIVWVDYLGFNTVKKLTNDKIRYFRKKDFKNNYDQVDWMLENGISEFFYGCEFFAVEGYAFAAKGLIFEIAEISGIAKHHIYHQNCKMRVYEPTTIKLFSTNKGNSNKVAMQEAYDKYPEISEKFDLNWMDDYLSPKSDIIDAWWITKLLQTELKIRNNLLDLNTLSTKQQQVFRKVSKKTSENLLQKPFLHKNA